MNSNEELCLPLDYHSRPSANEKLVNHDGGQWLVYKYAAKLTPHIKTVLDYGCGTGYDLLRYFGDRQTIGVDVPFRIPEIQARFPNHRWVPAPVSADADLVLCVDVIEHVDDPIQLLQHLASGQWAHLIIATPDRKLVAKYKCSGSEAKQRQINGPPRNPHHCREWTRDEFQRFLTQTLAGETQISTRVLGRFNVVAHIQRPLQT